MLGVHSACSLEAAGPVSVVNNRGKSIEEEESGG